MISIIVAATENNVIGHLSKLPWYLPRDLKHFSSLTTGNTTVMGRKTYESIIARIGQPLPNRKNVIITRQKDFKAPGCIVVGSWEEAKKATKGENVFVSGGRDIYEIALPDTDKLYITRIHTISEGDTNLPSINMNDWKEVSKEFHKKDDKNEFDLTFYTYERKTKQDR
jgi:dihydrofolate reductase